MLSLQFRARCHSLARKSACSLLVIGAHMTLGCTKPSSPPASHAAHTQGAMGSCVTDDRVVQPVAKMRIEGDKHRLTFEVVSMTPEQPVKGKASMTVRLLDSDGKPVTGAQLSLTMFMPDHGHGTPSPPEVIEEDGLYRIGNIDYVMSGVWRMSFAAHDVAGARDDTGVVLFCVS